MDLKYRCGVLSMAVRLDVVVGRVGVAGRASQSVCCSMVAIDSGGGGGGLNTGLVV